MKIELVHTLTASFEGHAQTTENGIEFWLARDLQHLLGYAEWRNFGLVINKAKTACEVSGHLIADHFVAINKMIAMPKEVPNNTRKKPLCCRGFSLLTPLWIAISIE